MSESKVFEILNSLAEQTDREFVLQIISQYKLSYEQIIEKLREALDSSDAQGISSQSHFMISSTAQIGGITLSEIFRELETIGKSGDLDLAKLKLSEIEHEYKNLVQILEKF